MNLHPHGAVLLVEDPGSRLGSSQSKSSWARVTEPFRSASSA